MRSNTRLPGGAIAVEAVADEFDVRIAVSDTGIGIPFDHQHAVFDRFYRVEHENSRSDSAGIGLALVRELTEAADGAVRLSSQPGRGTTVTVSLPKHRYRPQNGGTVRKPLEKASIALEVQSIESLHVGAESQPGQDGEEAPSILIVDDNADMREYLRVSLSDRYACITAANGKEALELSMEQVPDLVLCDLMMPGLNGFEVCDALKEDDRTSHIPIVMLTASGGQETRLSAYRHRADDYLTKPFDQSELEVRIANLLTLRDVLRTRFSRQVYEEEPAGPIHNEKEQVFLDKLHALLENSYADLDFGLSDMARGMTVSERQLQRKLKAVVGHTPAEYLRAYRLRMALQRLRTGQKIGPVAYAVGFSSQAYFTRCFKAQYGTTPKQFQQHAS